MLTLAIHACIIISSRSNTATATQARVRAMKIKYAEPKTAFDKRMGCYSFEIKESISALHFKQLMGMARNYNRDAKTGCIAKASKAKFLALVKVVEASSSEESKASHKRAATKKAAAFSESDFRDWMEDMYPHENLKPLSQLSKYIEQYNS